MRKLLPVILIIAFLSFPLLSEEIIIFHSNDIHAKIDNFPQLAHIIKKERASGKEVFYFVAGDMFSGSPYVDQYTPKGDPLLVLFKNVGVDLFCPGNHDFDYSQKIFKRFRERVGAEWVCSNINTEKSMVKEFKKSLIITTKNKTRIKVFGLIQVDEDSGIPSALPEKVEGLKFYDPLNYYKNTDSLRAGSDILIGLTHLGAETDAELAKKLNGIDLIIGGHSHTIINKPLTVNGTRIVQAGGNNTLLGKIVLKIKNNKLVSIESELIDLAKYRFKDSETALKVKEFKENPVLEKKITDIGVELQGKYELGSMVTDAIVNRMKVDFAFYNSGGLRINSIGPLIRLRDVYALHPFGNYIVKLNMTGREVIGLVRADFKRNKKVDFKVSGLTYTITHDLKKNIVDVRVRDNEGKVLDPEKTYKVGLTNYVLTSYVFDHKDKGFSTETAVANIVIDYLSTNPVCKQYKKEKKRAYGKQVLTNRDKSSAVALAHVSEDLAVPQDKFMVNAAPGNLLADSMRSEARTDFAFFPTRLLKAGLSLKRGDTFYRFHVKGFYDYVYKNKILTCYMRGADIIKFVYSRFKRRNSIDLQVSGLTVKVKMKKGRMKGVRLYDMNNNEIRYSKIYKIAFNDYDFYKFYNLKQAKKRERTDISPGAALEKYLKTKKSIPAEVYKNRVRGLRK